MAHRLFDELHLMIGPEIVAGDHPVFAGVVPETDLGRLGQRRTQLRDGRFATLTNDSRR